MSPKARKESPPHKVKRVSLPGDEQQHPWLRILLDAYHVLDRGVMRSVESERKKGRGLACAKGCFHCCRTHQDIPVYPLELVGMSWYAAEKVDWPQREELKRQLSAFRKTDPCPFLVGGTCAIHPLRPMACRQFNVFGPPCGPGEDPYHSRREDVMDPVKKYVDQAFFIMLEYHGVEKDSERARIVENGGMHTMVKELHGCNWRLLAERMESADNRRTRDDKQRTVRDQGSGDRNDEQKTKNDELRNLRSTDFDF